MGLSRWWLDLLLGSVFVWGWLGGGFGAQGGPVDSWLAVLSLVVLRLGGFGPCRGQVVLALMVGVGFPGKFYRFNVVIYETKQSNFFGGRVPVRGWVVF